MTIRRVIMTWIIVSDSDRLTMCPVVDVQQLIAKCVFSGQLCHWLSIWNTGVLNRAYSRVSTAKLTVSDSCGCSV